MQNNNIGDAKNLCSAFSLMERKENDRLYELWLQLFVYGCPTYHSCNLLNFFSWYSMLNVIKMFQPNLLLHC